MPKADYILDTMRKLGYPEAFIENFVFDALKGSYIHQRLAIINKMDELLTQEQRLAIMQEQGCCVSGKPAAAHRAFGRKHADKTVAQRIPLLDEVETPHRPPCRLNEDGTLSVSWGIKKDGKYQCVCPNKRGLDPATEISPTYCCCGAGHARQNLQRSLGVQLRLKALVSSPLSTKGEKPCEFLF